MDMSITKQAHKMLEMVQQDFDRASDELKCLIGDVNDKDCGGWTSFEVDLYHERAHKVSVLVEKDLIDAFEGRKLLADLTITSISFNI